MSKLDELVQKLAWARAKLAKIKAVIKEMKQELEESEPWQTWSSLKKDYADHAARIDLALREHAILFGKGRHHDAVEVQEWTILDYDLEKTIEWCYANLREALVLNTPVFERHARAVMKTKPVPCVTVGKEFNVKISKDLSAYLPEEEMDDQCSVL